MSDSEASNGEDDTRLGKLAHVARHPYNVATSKPAQRAYLGTALAIIVTSFLFVVSTVAYILFYYSYVPDIGAQHVVHLQFGNGHPYGTIFLSPTLISNQAYDISLSMHLPRTPSNLATGNFMIDMALLLPSTPLLSPVELLQSSIGTVNASSQAITRSRRPTILTHLSPLVENAHIVANILWYILGWKRESETLNVPMFEGISFARGQKNVPDKIQVVVEADEKMQFYNVAVRVRAQFRGLRWVMYNHRILSFLFFQGTFFGVSLVFAGGAYFVFSARSETEREKGPKVKEEDSDPLSTANLSDTPRMFPSIGRREGLAFEGRPPAVGAAAAYGQDVRVKQEQDEIERSAGIHPLTAEADDEDDDAESWRDSGIGTGRESERRRGSGPRRRKSREGGF